MRLVGVREFDAARAHARPGAEVVPPAAHRQFLLLFDLSFSGVNGLVRAQKAALEFVTHKLGPRDLAAVATFSANHGVRLLVGFTSDRFQLRRALRTLGVLQLDQHADPLGLAFDLRDLGRRPRTTLSEERGDSSRGVDPRHPDPLRARAGGRSTASGCWPCSTGCASSPWPSTSMQGRKQVIYFSNGFDETALEGQGGRAAGQGLGGGLARPAVGGRLREPVRRRADPRRTWRRMLQAFSSSDSLVHSVDLSGPVRARGRRASRRAEPQMRSGQGSLSEMARLSGGRFFRNTNDPGVALGEIAEMSRHYYLLAFEPQQARGPGRFHKLKVAGARARAATVSHRSGYYERAAYADRPAMARRFEAAEIIAKGIDVDEIPMRVDRRARTATADGKVTLPFVLEADGAAVLRGRAGRTRRPRDLRLRAGRGGHGRRTWSRFTSTLEVASVGSAAARPRPAVPRHLHPEPGRAFAALPGARQRPAGARARAGWTSPCPTSIPRRCCSFPPLFMDERAGVAHPARRPRARSPDPVSPFHVAVGARSRRARAPRSPTGAPSACCLLAFDGGTRLRSRRVLRDQARSSWTPTGAPVRLGRVEVVAGGGGHGRVPAVRAGRHPRRPRSPATTRCASACAIPPPAASARPSRPSASTDVRPLHSRA